MEKKPEMQEFLIELGDLMKKYDAKIQTYDDLYGYGHIIFTVQGQEEEFQKSSLDASDLPTLSPEEFRERNSK